MLIFPAADLDSFNDPPRISFAFNLPIACSSFDASFFAGTLLGGGIGVGSTKRWNCCWLQPSAKTE